MIEFVCYNCHATTTESDDSKGISECGCCCHASGVRTEVTDVSDVVPTAVSPKKSLAEICNDFDKLEAGMIDRNTSPDTPTEKDYYAGFGKDYAIHNPKLQYSLIPPTALAECAKGWTAGADIHPLDHWKTLEHSVFIDKIFRHLQQYRMGETHDTETGVHHLACCANNCMMLCEKDLTK